MPFIDDYDILYADVREVTEKGLQFLLLDTYQQLWVLIKRYIRSSANSGPNAGISLTVHTEYGKTHR